MKKTLTILAIVAVALVAMMGSTFAATVGVTPTNVQKVEEGKEVTVTVTHAESLAVTFTMEYDANNFQFVSSSATSSHVVKPGEVNISDMKDPTTVTLTFKALKTIDATQAFNVVKLNAGREANENPTASGELVITTTPVVEPSKDPESQANPPAATATTTTTEKEESETAKGIVGTNGDTIKRLPDTGTSVVTGVVALVAIAGVVLVVRKIRK